ncbi:MAG TPA: iron-containing redox enzyme family protein [Candidatus Binataceae bacterium]|nr:iron-containing redox enzyme family protein [Candidatus Binataceae bacterium]
MKVNAIDGTAGGARHAAALQGPGFARFQRELTRYNAARFRAQLPEEMADGELGREAAWARAEMAFVEALRRAIAPLMANMPSDADGFVAWFETLKQSGPGQGDSLFPFLAESASLDQMKWFLWQEVAGEAGFEDLLAMTQVKMPEQAKLEMARNFWDEMGRGFAKGMHGPMLARLADYFGLAPSPDDVVPESLALGNTMVALARHRRYAFHSVGALGVIEMTAPTRAGFVDRGLRRLGVPAKKRHYFALHAVLDVRHSKAWNREVVRTLVAEDKRRARAIGEGALMRLWHGARCFERYRREFGINSRATAAA